MSQSAGNWTMGSGGIITFFGLCLLPAALSDAHDASSVALAGSLFSFGALTMAGGFYLKARALGEGSSRSKRENGSQGRKLKGSCESCHADEAAVQCTVHRIHLCANCLSQHYDFRSCAYTPSTRRGAVRAAKSQAMKAGRS